MTPWLMHIRAPDLIRLRSRHRGIPEASTSAAVTIPANRDEPGTSAASMQPRMAGGTDMARERAT
jgi:hypothetical protein